MTCVKSTFSRCAKVFLRSPVGDTLEIGRVVSVKCHASAKGNLGSVAIRTTDLVRAKQWPIGTVILLDITLSDHKAGAAVLFDGIGPLKVAHVLPSKEEGMIPCATIILVPTERPAYWPTIQPSAPGNPWRG